MSLDAKIGPELVHYSTSKFNELLSDPEVPESEDACWIPYFLKFARVCIHTSSPVWGSDQGNYYVLVDLIDKGLFIEGYDFKTDELQEAFFIPWGGIQRLEFRDVTKNNLVTDPEFMDTDELS